MSFISDRLKQNLLLNPIRPSLKRVCSIQAQLVASTSITTRCEGDGKVCPSEGNYIEALVKHSLSYKQCPNLDTTGCIFKCIILVQ